MRREGSHPHPEGRGEGAGELGGAESTSHRSPPGGRNRRIWVSRLRLIGKRNAGPPRPCTDPPRFVRYLRYAIYVLAIAIVAAVTIKSLHGATRSPEAGQGPGPHDSTRPEAVERLGVDLRAPHWTRPL
jgi:hypothetical protein